MAIVPGRQFGNYQIVRQIGEGGFAEVYEVENPLLQRRAAIKVLHAQLNQDPALVRRFLNEARAASAIHHPNIIEVFDAGITPEGQPYILMEFLDGESLQRFIASRGRLPLSIVQEITRQACSALAAAHAANIVHRDLKPENLFVLQNPASPKDLHVKVLDFGIAKVKHKDSKGATQTRSGVIMGSPAYMSPEQCRDSSDVDHRTDIYSMGVIVYEMLAGAPPFACESAVEMMVLQMSAAPSALRLRVPDAPEYVEQAVMRALAKERTARFDSLDRFIGALLGTYPTRTTEGRPPPLGEEPEKPVSDAPGSAVSRAVSTSPRSRTSIDPSLVRDPSPPSGIADSSLARSPSRPSWLSSSPTGTTLAEAAGESTGEDGNRTTRRKAGRPRRQPWPFVVAGGIVLIALTLVVGIVFLKREEPTKKLPTATSTENAPGTTHPSPPKTVTLRVQSAPTGATVFNDHDKTELGQTPLDKVVAQGEGSLGLTLRLAGYKDENVSLGLGADASVLVNLESLNADRMGSSRGKNRERHGLLQKERTSKTAHSAETEGKAPARPAEAGGRNPYGWKGH